MRQRLFFIPLALLILLAACAPTADEPAAEAEPSTTTPPLKEITRERPTASPEPAKPGPPATIEPAAGVDGASSTESESGSVSPAEVDISQITSVPSTENDPVVMPQPGVPDPKAATAHQVTQDLASRAGVDISEIQMLDIKEIEWPDGALGCPAPGKNYLAAITPGYRITLELSGAQYIYHTDLHDSYLLCGDNGRPVTP